MPLEMAATDNSVDRPIRITVGIIIRAQPPTRVAMPMPMPTADTVPSGVRSIGGGSQGRQGGNEDANGPSRRDAVAATTTKLAMICRGKRSVPSWCSSVRWPSSACIISITIGTVQTTVAAQRHCNRARGCAVAVGSVQGITCTYQTIRTIHTTFDPTLLMRRRARRRWTHPASPTLW